MKRWALAVMAGAALWAGAATPSEAGWLMKPDCKIRIDGILYEGTWAFIGDRPYVNVESFGKALGLPRVHNVKVFYLGKEGKPKGSPFQMAVETAKGKLPVARFGGATYVDLEAACRALDIPFHRDTDGKFFEVGNPYMGEYMVGAWYRWYSNKYNWYYKGDNPGGSMDWTILHAECVSAFPWVASPVVDYPGYRHEDCPGARVRGRNVFTPYPPKCDCDD